MSDVDPSGPVVQGAVGTLEVSKAFLLVEAAGAPVESEAGSWSWRGGICGLKKQR